MSANGREAGVPGKPEFGVLGWEAGHAPSGVIQGGSHWPGNMSLKRFGAKRQKNSTLPSPGTTEKMNGR